MEEKNDHQGVSLPARVVRTADTLCGLVADARTEVLPGLDAWAAWLDAGHGEKEEFPAEVVLGDWIPALRLLAQIQQRLEWACRAGEHWSGRIKTLQEWEQAEQKLGELRGKRGKRKVAESP